MSKFFTTFCFGLTAVFSAQLNAGVVAVINSGVDVPAVSTNDLLTGLTIANDPLAVLLGEHNWPGASNGEINDGLNANPFNQNDGIQSATVTAPSLYTFALDTSVNVDGYDITNVDVFSAWTGSRARHSYDLLFSSDGGVTFDPIFTVSGAGVNDSLNSSQISDDTGVPLAFGVTHVQFDVGLGVAGDNNSGTVFREIDVIGTASVPVPEPSAALALVGGFGLAFLRRRK